MRYRAAERPCQKQRRPHHTSVAEVVDGAVNGCAARAIGTSFSVLSFTAGDHFLLGCPLERGSHLRRLRRQ